MRILIDENDYLELEAALDYFKRYCSENWSSDLSHFLSQNISRIHSIQEELRSYFLEDLERENWSPVLEETFDVSDYFNYSEDSEEDSEERVQKNIEKWCARFRYYHDLISKLSHYLEDCGYEVITVMEIPVENSHSSGDLQKPPDFIISLNGVGLLIKIKNHGILKILDPYKDPEVYSIYFPRYFLETECTADLEKVNRLIDQKFFKNSFCY